jgi:vancomycin permeability regulator SanA
MLLPAVVLVIFHRIYVREREDYSYRGHVWRRLQALPASLHALVYSTSDIMKQDARQNDK